MTIAFRYFLIVNKHEGGVGEIPHVNVLCLKRFNDSPFCHFVVAGSFHLLIQESIYL
jgi:hypothetical protein